jgi:hypothetical protein
MDYPGNSYKQRGIMKNFPVPSPKIFENDQGHYFVRIKSMVWPTIYGEQLPIHFPKINAALRFAENNISHTMPVIRVYSPDGELAEVFTVDRF